VSTLKLLATSPAKLSSRQRLTLAASFLAVLLLQCWSIGAPSLWMDEVATIAAANRPLASLWKMLGNIDAVHGLYYLGMHAYGLVFGFSPFAIRLPSAVAIALAVLFTWFVARRLFGETVAWISMPIAALLPRLNWAATEGRSYAFQALFAILLILLLLKILSAEPAQRRLLWVAYGVLQTLGTYLFIYFCVLAFAHGLWIFAKRRDLFKGWLITFGMAVLASTWILALANLQKNQIGWLPKIDAGTVIEFFQSQYFMYNPTLAFLANGILLVVILGGVRIGLSSWQASATQFLGLQLVLTPLVTIAYSLVAKPIYNSRYQTALAPIVAILLAVGIHQIFSNRIKWVALGLIVGLCLPNYLEFRAAHAKESNSNWTEIADIVGEIKKPGDGVLFTDFQRATPTLGRLPIAYPQDFAGVKDLTLTLSYRESHGLYDQRMPVADSIPRWKNLSRILVVADAREFAQYRQLEGMLLQQGFHRDGRKHITGTSIVTFSR
jgi:mannosyltransferase